MITAPFSAMAEWSATPARLGLPLRRSLARVAFALLLLVPLCAAQGRPVADAPMRATIILNIIRFVDFGADQSGPLLLCVARASGATRATATLDGQRVGTRPIAHRAFDGIDATDCTIAYLGAGNTAAIPRLRRTGMLLIGDGEEFIEAGGTIGLVGAGNQLRFEANTKAARESRIRLSSKLLRLARRIR
jgi:hypothetical protein